MEEFGRNMDFIPDLIQKLSTITGEQLHRSYYMYFDETNNIKSVKANKNPEQNRTLNIENIREHFVLGGIATKDIEEPISVDELKKLTHIMQGPNMKEIKSHNIYSGDFLHVICASKLTHILELIRDKHWFIHCCDVNLLYYSLVDIVDSLVFNSSYSQFIWNPYVFYGIKDTFYKIFINDLEDNLTTLMSFDYPNVKKDRLHEFREFLTDMVLRHYHKTGRMDNMLAFICKVIIDSDINHRNLVFIEDEMKGILINDFIQFYTTRLCALSHSTLVLDEEGDVVESLKKEPLMIDGKPLINYRFIDSKDNTFIQLSDIIVGILARLYEYIDSDWDVVKKGLETLSSEGKKNLRLLNDILFYSEQENSLFFNQIERVGVIKNFWHLVGEYKTE